MTPANKIAAGLFMLAMLGTAGCGKHSATTTGSANVLATVDGSPITRMDVDREAIKLLGPQRAASMDATLRKKVLDGLVLSRALAQAAEGELTATDKDNLAVQVADYREQLLVKRYLKAHANPLPVTEEMIGDYYRKHPEQFGGGERRHYEMLLVTQAVTEQQRKRIVTEFGKALGHTDWKGVAAMLRKAGLPVVLRTGTDAGEMPNEAVADVLRSLKERQTSDVAFANGLPFLVRVTKVDKLQPKPLESVREEIRRELFPVRVKQAIDVAKNQVEGKVDIKYIHSNGS